VLLSYSGRGSCRLTSQYLRSISSLTLFHLPYYSLSLSVSLIKPLVYLIQVTLYTACHHPRQAKTNRNLTYVCLSLLISAAVIHDTDWLAPIIPEYPIFFFDSGSIPLCSCLYVHPGISLFIHCYPTTLGTGILRRLFPPSPFLSPICLPLASVHVAEVVSRPARLCFSFLFSVHHTAIDMSDDMRKIPISHPSCSLDFLTPTFLVLGHSGHGFLCLVLSCHLWSTCGMRL